jgi:flagellar operon protein
MSEIGSVKPPFIPIGGVEELNRKKVDTEKIKGRSFEDIFENQLKENDLKFSVHAQKRMYSRNIQLNEGELNDLKTAITKAEEKGAKESLVLMKDTGFIVSIKNRTVITAVNQNELKENVFTNIDSAVII